MNNFPVSFTRQIMQLRRSTKITAATLAVTSVCLLPTLALVNSRIGRVLVASSGLACSLVGKRALDDSEEIDAVSEDLCIVDRKQTLHWYNDLLSKPHTAQVDLQRMSAELERPSGAAIPDVVSYWVEQDKHILVIGGTGAGKSYFVQAFASHLGTDWNYRLYDNDCTIDDWAYIRQLPSAILFENYSSIGKAMAEDLDTLESRTIQRKHKGNKWTTEQTLTVAEEMPSLVEECVVASDWMSKLAKRGRRVKQFMAVVAQNDTVKNLGLVGDSKLRDSCFVRVYLGQSAIDRAKELKQPQTVEWLRAGGKGVCLVDDLTAIRPVPL